MSTNQRAEVYDRREHPFYIVYNDVIELFGPTIGVYGLAVYNVLAYYANEKHEAWPSYQTIADHLGISRRKVVDIIDMLASEGLIAKESRLSPSGDPTSNVYTLLAIRPKPSARHAPPDAQDAPPSATRSPGSARHAPPPSAQDALRSAQHAHDQDPMNNTQLDQDPRNKREGAAPPPAPADPPPQIVRSRKPTSDKIRIDSPHLKGAQFVDSFIPPGTGTNAVQVYYERFCINEKAAILRPIQEDDLVRECTDLGRLRDVVTAYSLTNYRPGNVRLILDWYRDGIPGRPANGAGTAGTPARRTKGGSAVEEFFADLESEGMCLDE